MSSVRAVIYNIEGRADGANVRRFDLRLAYFEFTFHRPSMHQFSEETNPTRQSCLTSCPFGSASLCYPFYDLSEERPNTELDSETWN